MVKELASAKIKLALKRKTPAAADRIYQPSDKVIVWRERQVEHRTGEYLGPYIFLA